MNFLVVHPRTALWWEQREVCRRCVNQAETPLTRKANNGVAGGGMTCSAAAHTDSCISARDAGAACGPDARLFKALS